MRGVVVAGAAAVLAAGCSLGRFGGGGPVPEVERNGVVYWAQTSFLPGDPVRIQTIVGAVNRRSGAVEVTTVACPVFVRLYGAPTRVGLPVWDEGPAYVRWVGAQGRDARKEVLECRAKGDPVVIEPGDSTWLTIAVVEPAGMGDTIPPGRYYFTAVVPLEGRRLELISGESELDGVASAGASEGRSGEGGRPESSEGR